MKQHKDNSLKLLDGIEIKYRVNYYDHYCITINFNDIKKTTFRFEGLNFRVEQWLEYRRSLDEDALRYPQEEVVFPPEYLEIPEIKEFREFQKVFYTDNKDKIDYGSIKNERY